MGERAVNAGRFRSVQTTWQRALLWWLRAMLVFLALSGVVLATSRPSRAVVLLVLVPLSFLPFCYARARVFARCTAILSHYRGVGVVSGILLLAGCVADAVMLAQLLTARSPIRLPDRSKMVFADPFI